MNRTKSGWGAAGSYLLAVVAPTISVGADAMGYEWAPAAGPWLVAVGILFGVLGTYCLFKAISPSKAGPKPEPEPVEADQAEPASHNEPMSRAIVVIEEVLSDGLPRTEAEISINLQSRGVGADAAYTRVLLLYMKSKGQVLLHDGCWRLP